MESHGKDRAGSVLHCARKPSEICRGQPTRKMLSPSFPRLWGLMPTSTWMQRWGLQSTAEEKQVFSPCGSSLRSLLVQAELWECGAGWNQPLQSHQLEAGSWLFLEHLGPAFPREHVPGLTGTLHSLGIAQDTPFITEEWKNILCSAAGGVSACFFTCFSWICSKRGGSSVSYPSSDVPRVEGGTSQGAAFSSRTGRQCRCC